MATAKRKRRAKTPRRKAQRSESTRIPKALRTEARRMRQQGRIPQRLIDSLPSDTIDELFPDLDESDIYD